MTIIHPSLNAGFVVSGAMHRQLLGIILGLRPTQTAHTFKLLKVIFSLLIAKLFAQATINLLVGSLVGWGDKAISIHRTICCNKTFLRLPVQAVLYHMSGMLGQPDFPLSHDTVHLYG